MSSGGVPGLPPASYGGKFEDGMRDHGLLASVVFLVLMPSGILFVRYVRTFTTKWWFVHSLLSGFIPGSLIIASWVKAHQISGETPRRASAHTRIGFVIFGLSITQIVLGLFIHFVPVKPFLFGGSRPPQNYIHPLLGLTIVGLAEYQIYDGIYSEWPKFTGNPISESAKHAWLALMIVFWSLYAFGLLLLPRQYRQERRLREARLEEKS